MCSECLRFICPENCPGSDGTSPFFGSPRHICDRCDEPIYRDAVYYDFYGEIICSTCIENMDIDELREYLGVGETGELLEKMGIRPHRA